MICPNKSSETSALRKTVVLTFSRDELLYSISNIAYVEGEIQGEDGQHATHQTQDVCEDGNIDRVSRIMAVAFSAAVEMLRPFTKRDVTSEVVTDRLWQPSEYRMELSLPGSFSETTVHLLSKLIHEFIVYTVLADWLSITNPTAAQAWVARAKYVTSEIRKLKSVPTDKIRRPSSPF